MALEFINLGIGFEQKPLFVGLNAALSAGESLAIMGCNGAGKSTLLKTLAQRHKVLAGSIKYASKPLQQKDVGYLPQSSNIIADIGINAGEFVNLSLDKSLSLKDMREYFAQYEIEDCLNIPLNQLSGGQLNRLKIIRLELQNPQIFLLDEPFAYLDNTSRNILINKISQWKQSGKIVIISIHDERLALEFDHFLTLDGKNALWEQKMKAHNKDCTLAGCALVG